LSHRWPTNRVTTALVQAALIIVGGLLAAMSASGLVFGYVG
jgi:hypothetical protein